MAKPRLIILVRHAQSEGNKNREIHQTIPDHRVKLTQDGWQQAYEAGRRLRSVLRADDTLHFFTSPYRRTRETTEGILASLTSDELEPSPFKRSNVKVYEEPRLREQDFGNFQPCSAEMERMWQERADYGHFFYRIPNGESAADAYDRVSGFNESLWRQFGEDDFASVCVLVTHGLMSRVFLMKWYHFSVEYFEDLRNVNHCEFLIMRKQDNGKYLLENKLRTWSELRRERALVAVKESGAKEGAKEDGTKGNGNSKDSSKLDKAHSLAVSSSPAEPRRRWGGCPDGCNHDKSFRIRQTLADLVKSDSTTSNHPANSDTPATPSSSSNNTGNNNKNDNNNTAAADGGAGVPNPSFNGNGNAVGIIKRRPAARRFQSQADGDGDGGPEASGPHIDVTKAHDEIVSSPDGTPSFISIEDRLRSRAKSPNMPPHPLLHAGRDFGGTYSGRTSLAASDADSSEDEGTRRRLLARLKSSAVTPAAAPTADSAHDNSNDSSARTSPGTGTGVLPHHHHHHHHHRDQSRMGRGTRANRLGDAPYSSDGEHDDDGDDDNDMDEEERKERSVQESVY